MSAAAEHRRVVTRGELDEPLLAYGDAVQRIVASFEALPATEVALSDALGLVLARDVVAHDEIPAFDNSAMDGWAVRSSDLAAGGAELRVADEVAPGAAVKVMTGQPIPDGADAVVPWERASAPEDGRFVAEGPVESGRFVRRAGEDLHAGDVVLRAGTVIDAVAVGLAAAVGADRLLLHLRPRVAVLSTGDELVDVTEPIGRGRVRDANGPLLAAIAVAAGATVVATERVPDDPDQIAGALHRLAAVSDLVVTSGGASVGEKDWLRTVLEREGELSFWRIAMRPGKPVASGRVDDTAVIVLPGNPGSVVACSHVVVARAIRCLAGRPAQPTTFPSTLANAIEGDPARTVVHPVRRHGDQVVPADVRSSQVLSNALGAHGWVIVPPGGLPVGAHVEVEQ
ncbi:MAG: gephyrin-like molybdotransferase Glp [Microthrixaceae bacterium]